MSTNANDNPFVISVTDDSFEADVVQSSNKQPVVVDFWATWCGPCRALGPILEKLAAEYAGQFILAKAETDYVPNAARQFGVSSIPAVFAVANGEVVDGFIGALPERQIRDWLDRLLQMSDALALIHLVDTDPAAAEKSLREWIARSPNDPQPRVALAKALMHLGRDDECHRAVEELEKLGFMDSEAEKIRATLDLRSKKSANLDELRQQAVKDSTDWNLQLQFAQALAAAQQYEESLDTLLRIVQRDRKGVGERARAAMIDIFRVLGDSPLVSDYRRKLSVALY